MLTISTKSFAVETATQDAIRKFVNNIGNEIVKTAGNSSLSEDKKRTNIINIVDSSIDANWIARFVLGKSYKTASEEQKQAFTKLYREFMINTYGPKFKNYDGRKFEVFTVTEQSGFYVAKAEFLPKNSNTPISVDFRVKDRDGKLVILDFIAEGVSLIETQRSEFNSAITQKGMDDFLKELEVRVKNLKK